MDAVAFVSSWVPDRRPTRTEWLATAIMIVHASFIVAWSDVSFPAAAVSFAATVVTLGPVARSRIGTWIDDRWGAMSLASRGLVILVVAIAILFVVSTVAVPDPVVLGISLGIMSGAVVFLLAQGVLTTHRDGTTPN